MAKLGEAYVRIRADLGPFAKDLDKGLKTITDKFERSLNRKFGQAIGKDMGSGVRDGLRESSIGINAELDKGLNVPANNRRRGRKAGQDFGDGYGDGIFGTIKRVSGLFITALEDGFSSLPPQVKGVVGAALVAAIVPAGAFLSAAVGAAVIAGTVGIGVALATQFTEVENEWGTFVTRLRERAVKEAEPFAGQTIAALDLFDKKLDELDPKISSLFSNASRYVEPFARGAAAAVDGFVTGLDRGIANADFSRLSGVIETGLGDIGVQLGETFETLLSNPDLSVSLEDLLQVVEDLVYVGGEFLNWTVSAYSTLKDIGQVVGGVADGFGDFAKVLASLTQGADEDGFAELENSWNELLNHFGAGDEVRIGMRRIDNTQREWNDTTSATIKLTKEQEKALAELNKQLAAELRLTNDVIGTQIDYQAAIDQTTADLKENGRTLDIRNEKGRENATNVQREINSLRDQITAQLESGKLTEDQARTFYNNEIARIRARFNGNKTVLAQFDELFGKLTTLNGIPPVQNKVGPLAAALGPLLTALGQVQARLNSIRQTSLPSYSNKSGVGPGQQKYAEGGFITEPTNALMGENYREEVVLPLTNTRRSMQLLSRSPLAGMLGGSSNVAVYIGNEQLATRQFKVAQGVNRQAARTLSQTPRMV